MVALPSPIPFLADARAHTRAWLESELGVESRDPVRVLLPRADASAGRNFLSRGGVIQAVRDRFPNSFKGAMGPGSRAGDAPCSAHAPFNLLAPLVDFGAAHRVLSAALGIRLDSIEGVQFEQPRRKSSNPLGDNTSFDGFVVARSRRELVLVGVEVKLSEGPYSWGTREREEMLNPKSEYNRRTQTCGWFTSGAQSSLATTHLKQMWRNTLLAQAVGEREGVACYLMHLYPSGNVYQHAAAAAFADLLSATGRDLFTPLAYEDYFDTLEAEEADAGWVGYCRRRYLVSPVD